MIHSAIKRNNRKRKKIKRRLTGRRVVLPCNQSYRCHPRMTDNIPTWDISWCVLTWHDILHLTVLLTWKLKKQPLPERGHLGVRDAGHVWKARRWNRRFSYFVPRYVTSTHGSSGVWSRWRRRILDCLWGEHRNRRERHFQCLWREVNMGVFVRFLQSPIVPLVFPVQ